MTLRTSQPDAKEKQQDGYLKPDECNINEQIGKYRVLGTLGTGSSGNVLLAEDPDTGAQVAIKVVDRNVRPGKTKIKEADVATDVRVYREILISSLVNHPNIVRLLDFLYSSKYFFLVFSHVKGEQLYDVVVKNGCIPEERARRYFRQMLSAIQYIHRNCITHRDLKIENILVDENDNIRIIDFGLSNFYDTKTLLNTFCGSLYFAAPELLLSKSYYGPEIDIWSLGVILYVMLCGRVPFDDESVSALQNKIKDGNFEFTGELSQSARDLVNGMLVPSPADRLSLDAVEQSEWVCLGYEYEIESHVDPWEKSTELDMGAVKALSAAAAFQFPEAEAELVGYSEMCTQGFESLGKMYWTRRPVIALYHMMVRENAYRKKITSKLLNRVFVKKKASDVGFPAILHSFVRFVFDRLDDNTYTRYFTRSVFAPSSPPVNTAAPIIWPCVRKAYLKGFFKGIKAKHVASPTALKAVLLEIFVKNNIVYEVGEKSYFCSYSDSGEECYFKVSMYFNAILSEYFFVLTCLNSKRDLFRSVATTIKEEIVSRQPGSMLQC